MDEMCTRIRNYWIIKYEPVFPSVGDSVQFFLSGFKGYADTEITRTITHIEYGEGLADGYCALSFQPLIGPLQCGALQDPEGQRRGKPIEETQPEESSGREIRFNKCNNQNEENHASD